MANTHPNQTGSIERIHAELPLAVLAEGLSLSLSQSSEFARIDLENAALRRRFLGKTALHFDLVDRSGIDDIYSHAPSRRHIRLRLGHSAVIGREADSELPILNSPVVSEAHLRLSYVRHGGKDRLSIHDYDSRNGSHLSTTSESTWSERIAEISADDTSSHHDSAAPTDAQTWEWLFDATVPPPRKQFSTL